MNSNTPWSLNLARLQTVERSFSVPKPPALRDVKKRIGYEARVALGQIILALAPAKRVPQPVVTITPPTPIALEACDTIPELYDAPEVVPLPARGGFFIGQPPTVASALPPTLRGRSRRRGSWRSGLRARLGSRDDLCNDYEDLMLERSPSRDDIKAIRELSQDGRW
ncbi:unnamed protein product [Peniophora sp. CBMAI 1063]|nr:unnamed protein product [Peniophora sp. CBMAI 1063]